MRCAFTIIELLVSIVVIGIAMMSLPLALEQSAKSGEVANMQDSFFKASVLAKEISSKPWDAKSAAQYLDGNGSLFLDVANGDPTLVRVGNGRIGSFSADNTMRIFYPQITTASTISSGNFNAIESFNGYETASNNLKLSVSVDYVPDGAIRVGNNESATWNLNGGQSSLTQSTNLKRIVVTATQNIGGNEQISRLTYFSSNIGANSFPIK
ncbi:MAG: hypothetical protein RL154_456 [Pseudomonadota bacterium]|jgi:prepilin-type N-terminal cleavage/methylation domain-containing protein